jgi:hypothetical protein
MSRYYTTSLFVFSILGGVVTFMLVSSMADVPTSVLFGAIATLGISIVIPSMFALSDRKFIPLRKEIKDPIVIDERVNYLVGNDIKQGFMITTKDSMFVISHGENAPVKFEIKKSDIKKISVSEGIYLNIFLDYDKCIRVFAANCEELSKKLQAEGFGK